MARQAPTRALAAAIVPLVALLGCGSKDDPTPTPKDSAPAASDPVSSPAAASPKVSPQPAATAEFRSAVPPGVDPKRPVAMVNGKPIMPEQVYSVYRMNKEMLQQRGRTLNEKDDQALRAESLEVVLADELLYQAALAQGVTASAPEIAAAMRQVKSRVGSQEGYKKFLAVSGMTEADVQREVVRNIQTETYRKGLVAGQGVSEDQAKKFYEANVAKGIFNVPEQVHVQYILVKANEKDPESARIDARKRAGEAERRAAAGEDFTALAKEYSQDATAARGGDIGFFPRGVMFPKFEEIAFAGKPGDVTPVFETPKGFNVMKILEKKPESTRSYEDVKSALMLDLGRVMEQDLVRAKIRELAAGAKIAILDASFARPGPPPPVAAKASPTRAP